ncbi:AUGMIN subunit 8 [Pyrus x bretschneideri]|uniref:AUGMIN subunit 8 n=1 Tax=Pyrus x bretschneideri TaxID=225117 RepID=UPI00202F9AF5|nr:AUGMIN subunit 8 [Pyrus x bretschneideri]XP_009358416.2 AUGMIN subunit 8 [Pyrus x bretschneideri]XP_048440112.1 AUGMIN subunit 8 [Pyrus x bretschneideri]
MDVRESALAALRKQIAVENPRLPLVPAGRNNNAVTTRHPRTREVSSRYKSPTTSSTTPSSPSGARRCPSPTLTRTSRPSSPLVSKRSQSVDRKRPSTPTSPPSPSTPVQDSSADVQLSSRRTANGRMPEGLWPSTMRSLSVSFQSDSISIPVSKKEKPVTSALSDRTLRSSSNVAHRQAETPAASRKLTPERKRSPVKGKNAPDQSENSKPVDALHSRLIDQHRWPSRIGGKVSSNSLNRSVDLGAKIVGLAAPAPVVGLSTLRRTRPSDSSGKPLQKSNSDAAALLSLHQSGRAGLGASADGNSLQVSGPHKLASTSLTGRLSSTSHSLKSQSLPSTPSQSRPSSPSRSSMFASSVTRGLSPSRSRPSTPPSRGVSPSKARPSGTSSQSSSSTSVLSFIADFKGKKGASCIEDAHQLRLLYNRCLQWRFANARAEAVLYVLKVNAERTLLNVWNTTLSLWDSVIKKRIDLQQLKLELKLKSVLNDQMAYLDDWDLLESDHIAAFSGAMEDLEASTLRLPVTGGARADLDSLKVAICSAVDVMQAMASSICSLLSQVEGVNSLVSELAVVAAQEKAMLDECEALLASAAAMQVEEYSLRTHLMQTKQDLAKASGQFWQPRHLLDPD